MPVDWVWDCPITPLKGVHIIRIQAPNTCTVHCPPAFRYQNNIFVEVVVVRGNTRMTLHGSSELLWTCLARVRRAQPRCSRPLLQRPDAPRLLLGECLSRWKTNAARCQDRCVTRFAVFSCFRCMLIDSGLFRRAFLLWDAEWEGSADRPDHFCL